MIILESINLITCLRCYCALSPPTAVIFSEFLGYNSRGTILGSLPKSLVSQQSSTIIETLESNT
ncbi:MAG: hypothetical protein ACYCSO_00320 [Cuniculiplasma sp.]